MMNIRAFSVGLRVNGAFPDPDVATESCTVSGEAYLVQGGTVQRFAPWTLSEKIDKGDRWTVAELAAEAEKLAPKK